MMQATFKKLPARRQEKILDGAAKVFARHGAHRAKISEICRTAGISNGALYKYFKNKEELFLSVIDHGVDLMVHELFAKFTPGTASFFEALEALFKGFGRFLEQHRPYVELYADLTACSMNKFSGHVAEKIESEGRNLFLRMVEEGKRRGEITRDIRSDLMAHFLDSHMTLYAYSLVSEYHGRRFNAFFRTGVRRLTEQDKIAIIAESARSFLQGPVRPAG
jgi:AcrR family transcriptional regulator